MLGYKIVVLFLYFFLAFRQWKNRSFFFFVTHIDGDCDNADNGEWMIIKSHSQISLYTPNQYSIRNSELKPNSINLRGINI